MRRHISELCDREYFGMKLGLKKIRRVLKRLGNPEKRLLAIHVAGTNGKGSTATMIARILEAADLKVGLFISPHLDQINERFQINGTTISDDRLNELVSQVEAADETGGGRLSFFEFMTIVAFLYFAEAGVDLAVIETGLGGRLDATNVIRPLVSVITPISYDHEKHLGAKLEQIAAEKGGIIKRRVPLVCAPQVPRVKQVLRRLAKHKAAPLHFAESPQLASDGHFRLDGFRNLWTPNLGRFQAVNAAVAVKAVQELVPQFRVSRRAVQDGLASTYLAGHMEIIQRNPLIVLDVAHNPAAIESLVESSRDLFRGRRIHCLFAAMKDKNVRGMLQQLRKMEPILYVTRPHMQRAMPAAELVAVANKEGLTAQAFENTSQALDALCAQLSPRHDALLITGSLFLVAEVRRDTVLKRKAA